MVAIDAGVAVVVEVVAVKGGGLEMSGIMAGTKANVHAKQRAKELGAKSKHASFMCFMACELTFGRSS